MEAVPSRKSKRIEDSDANKQSKMHKRSHPLNILLPRTDLAAKISKTKEQRRVFKHDDNGTAFCLNEEENEAAVDLHVKLAVAFHKGKREVKKLQDDAMALGGPGANAAAEKAVESCRSKLKDKIIRDEIERCAILGECDKAIKDLV